MEKLDLTKKYKSYYSAGKTPSIVHIESANYLSIAGKGDPSDPAFTKNIEALYPFAYAVKFACKAMGNDFVVAKLEGLWWFDEDKFRNVSMHDAPTKIPRSEWQYRLMIRLPDFVDDTIQETARKNLFDKNKLSVSPEIEMFTLAEGKCIQILHVGPFADEHKTLAIIGRFVQQHGLLRNGHHHEIYLSDFRRTPPSKLRTILREPVR